MVSDIGGIDDNSFNENAWKGMTDAQAQARHRGEVPRVLGHAGLREEHQPVHLRRLRHDRDRRVPARRRHEGRRRGQPDTRFAIVDFAYDPAIPNVEGLVYTTNEAAMLVGYVSAGMSQVRRSWARSAASTSAAGVTDFMDGFVAGANYYNKENGTTVRVLGWDAVTKEGSFTGDFESTDNAKHLTVPMLQEGADVILPVGGPIGGGAYAALQESAAQDYGIGVDVDWCVSAPAVQRRPADQRPQEDRRLRHRGRRARRQRRGPAARSSSARSPTAASDMGPFNEFEAAVPQELKDGVAALKAKIISGEVKVADYFAAP